MTFDTEFVDVPPYLRDPRLAPLLSDSARLGAILDAALAILTNQRVDSDALSDLTARGALMAADLSALTADVQTLLTATTAVQGNLSSLTDQIADLKAAAPPDDAATQAAIDAIDAEVKDAIANLTPAAAVTPPAPIETPPVDAPVVDPAPVATDPTAPVATPDPDAPAAGFPSTVPDPPAVPGITDPAPAPAPVADPPVVPGLTTPIDS